AVAKAPWVLAALTGPLALSVKGQSLNSTLSLYAGACLSVKTSSENFLEFLLFCSIEPRASATTDWPRLHQPRDAPPRLGRAIYRPRSRGPDHGAYNRPGGLGL